MCAWMGEGVSRVCSWLCAFLHGRAPSCLSSRTQVQRFQPQNLPQAPQIQHILNENLL